MKTKSLDLAALDPSSVDSARAVLTKRDGSVR
jgi:hypothetical protein